MATAELHEAFRTFEKTHVGAVKARLHEFLNSELFEAAEFTEHVVITAFSRELLRKASANHGSIQLTGGMGDVQPRPWGKDDTPETLEKAILEAKALIRHRLREEEQHLLKVATESEFATNPDLFSVKRFAVNVLVIAMQSVITDLSRSKDGTISFSL